MQDNKEQVEQFIRDLRSANYYNSVIRDYNLQLEDVRNQAQGVSSAHMKDVIYENVGNPYSSINKLELMERESLLMRERQRYIDRITECEKIELIENTKDKAMIVDLYVLKMKYDDVSKKFSYSRSSMFDKAKRILSNIL